MCKSLKLPFYFSVCGRFGPPTSIVRDHAKATERCQSYVVSLCAGLTTGQGARLDYSGQLCLPTLVIHLFPEDRVVDMRGCTNQLTPRHETWGSDDAPAKTGGMVSKESSSSSNHDGDNDGTRGSKEDTIVTAEIGMLTTDHCALSSPYSPSFCSSCSNGVVLNKGDQILTNDTSTSDGCGSCKSRENGNAERSAVAATFPRGKPSECKRYPEYRRSLVCPNPDAINSVV